MNNGVTNSHMHNSCCRIRDGYPQGWDGWEEADERVPGCFPRRRLQFTLSLVACKSPCCSTFSLTFGEVTFLHYCQTTGCKMVCYFCHNCIYLIINEFKYFLFQMHMNHQYFSSVQITNIYSFKCKYVYCAFYITY